MKEAKTFEDSILHCRRLGREVVSILSQDDANYFASLTDGIDTSGSTRGLISIGLHAPEKDCQWSWVGTTTAFNPGKWFWKSGEPNGCNTVEFCSSTEPGSSKFYDSTCDWTQYFVCGNPAGIVRSNLFYNLTWYIL